MKYILLVTVISMSSFQFAFSQYPETDSCKERMYDFATGSLTEHSCFISIFVRDSLNQTKRMITLNGELFNFCYLTKKMGVDAYREFIKDVIRKKRTVDFAEFQNLPPGWIIDENGYVDSLAKKGKSFFYNYFIRSDGFINSEEVKGAGLGLIVSKLWDWNILMFYQNGVPVVTWDCDKGGIFESPK